MQSHLASSISAYAYHGHDVALLYSFLCGGGQWQTLHQSSSLKPMTLLHHAIVGHKQRETWLPDPWFSQINQRYPKHLSSSARVYEGPLPPCSRMVDDSPFSERQRKKKRNLKKALPRSLKSTPGSKHRVHPALPHLKKKIGTKNERKGLIFIRLDPNP